MTSAGILIAEFCEVQSGKDDSRAELQRAGQLEDNVLLVWPARSTKSTPVSDTLEYLRDRIISRISQPTALIHGIDDQIG
ncbi:hypothetical protein CVM73_38525 [Bradyrhizobium forestalis]|uniref:Uncharacterized protein n=1 Tax=Bradyrhizobium forestalis TaxID=1419263 RepID=A0A2M8QWU0_9BRAD|nr:hypothetical protein CVM73_38525 [Bradyrhizobium forestalis]